MQVTPITDHLWHNGEKINIAIKVDVNVYQNFKYCIFFYDNPFPPGFNKCTISWTIEFKINTQRPEVWYVGFKNVNPNLQYVAACIYTRVF